MNDMIVMIKITIAITKNTVFSNRTKTTVVVNRSNTARSVLTGTQRHKKFDIATATEIQIIAEPTNEPTSAPAINETAFLKELTTFFDKCKHGISPLKILKKLIS